MSSELEVGYPAHWEADVVLRDGSTMHIRPIRPGDAAALQEFHTGQSEQSVYFRFFAALERLSDRDLARFTQVDHEHRVALVLVEPTDDDDRILAVGRFDRLETGGEVAEVAFNVSDGAQGRGLGSILLDHLAAAARERGIRKFVADVLPSNTRMLRVFTDAGYDASQVYADGVVEVSFPIRPTDRSIAVMTERERRAQALSLTALLEADGLVLLTTGAEGPILGERVQDQLRAAAFAGRVHRCDSVAALEELVEPHACGDEQRLPTLAVLAAPPEDVLAALPVLARGGVRALVLLSGGFSDSARSGFTSQRTLVRTLREHGLRLVGPRSFGVIAHGDGGRLSAIVGTTAPAPGDVGLFCQSTAAGRALIEQARTRHLGISSFLSAGRRVDISGNDTMQYWSSDDRTKVVCLSLDSIGNPRKFSRVARTLTARKPVVVAIGGTTGQLRPPGHVVRTSSAPRVVLRQLMSQAGVLLTESVRQQLDWAMLLSAQPLPAGDRVLTIGNSGSQAVVIGDLVAAHGLRSAGDPVVLAPTVDAQTVTATLADAARRQDWDMAVIAYGAFGVDVTDETASAAARLAHDSGRTVVVVVPGLRGLEPSLTWRPAAGKPVQVPAYEESTDAVSALAAARTYARTHDADPGAMVEPHGIDWKHARELIGTELLGVARGTSVRLAPHRAVELLASFGLSVLPATKVTDVDAALAAADQLGWPVALKASDELLRHRADLGGVQLDLATPAEVEEAFAALTELITATGRSHQIEVQRMAPAGASCVVGGVEDELYGPIISFGLAGDAHDMLGDVAYRIPPLRDADVADLVRSVKASPRLLGQSGLPALDVAALEDVIARVSVMKEELPEIASVRLNPVMVGREGAHIIWAVVDLAPTERADTARRALP